MPMRTKLFFSIACVCLGVALLLYISVNFAKKDPYVSPSDVRGISFVVGNVAHPVTYEEQTLLLKYFNQLKPLDPKEDVTKGTKPTLTKILIYHYKDTVTEVYTILYLGDSVVLQSSDWNGGALLKDTSHGELKKLLDRIYNQLQIQGRQTPPLPKDK